MKWIKKNAYNNINLTLSVDADVDLPPETGSVHHLAPLPGHQGRPAEILDTEK